MDRVVNNRQIWTGWSATDAREGVEQTENQGGQTLARVGYRQRDWVVSNRRWLGWGTEVDRVVRLVHAGLF